MKRIGRRPLRTPEANRRWRAFYQTRWTYAMIRKGRCPACGRRKYGTELQHQRCGRCRKKARLRELARYYANKERRAA